MSQKIIQKNNIIAGIIGICVIIIVIFNVLYPSFVISNQSKNNFSIKTIDNAKYLALKIEGGYSFHQIAIELNPNTNNNRRVNYFSDVYQNELGLYHLGIPISNKDQLDTFLKAGDGNLHIQNGELIQKGNFVYFISEGQYRAFANAETFDNLGFDWNKVRRDKDVLLNNLTKGEIIDKVIAYLPGFFVEIDEKVYLLGKEDKYLIDNDNLKKYIKKQFSVIKINSQKLRSVGKMHCEKRDSINIICKFKDSFKKTLPQARIFIKVDNNLPEHWKAKIQTFDGFKSIIPKITLNNIKRNIILKYDQRLGIGERVNK